MIKQQTHQIFLWIFFLYDQKLQTFPKSTIYIIKIKEHFFARLTIMISFMRKKI